MPAPIVGGALALGGALLSKKKGGGGGSGTEGPSTLATLAPSLISAGGSLAGALIGSKQSGKATDASLAATREALAYQKEKDAQSRADFAKAMMAYEANRNALLQRYGISIPDYGAAPQVSSGGQMSLSMPAGAQSFRGGSLASLMGQTAPGAAGVAAAPAEQWGWRGYRRARA